MSSLSIESFLSGYIEVLISSQQSERSQRSNSPLACPTPLLQNRLIKLDQTSDLEVLFYQVRRHRSMRRLSSSMMPWPSDSSPFLAECRSTLKVSSSFDESSSRTRQLESKREVVSHSIAIII
jgi:hypothetical protein